MDSRRIDYPIGLIGPIIPIGLIGSIIPIGLLALYASINPIYKEKKP